MRVYVYPAGKDGCGYYRMIWPALALKAQGHDVQLVMPQDRTMAQYQLTAAMQGDRVVDVMYPEDADVIVLQRVSHRNLSAAVPLIRAKGTTVVIDMDDDLTRIHPGNPAYQWLHPKFNQDHNWENASRACDQASWVTTSTPALQRVYARHGRGSVLYNTVEDRAFDLEGAADTGRFGWTGSLHSHPDDLKAMGPAAQRLVGEGFGFYMVGNPAGVAQELGLAGDAVQTSGIVDSTAWLEALSALHVGVAPLADTMFNAAKSWLKPLELASRGVPCVMSPRAEYRRIWEAGVGVLAGNPRDFYRQVKRLMTDDAWHAEVRERSLAGVRDLTIGTYAWRWAEAWDEAYRAEH